MNMTAKLTPYISSKDARTQADFYIRALGGEIVSIMTHGQIPNAPEELKDKVMHMTLSVAGGNLLFLSDAFESLSSNRSIALGLSFGDETQAREAYAQLGQGGTNKYPFEMQPWGAYYGEVEDRFGITWQIVSQP